MTIILIIIAIVVVLLLVANVGHWDAIDNLQTQILELEDKLEKCPYAKRDEDIESDL